MSTRAIVQGPIAAALHVLLTLLLPTGAAQAASAKAPTFAACTSADDQRVLSVDALSTPPP
ncbi:MAG: hypothetical protein ABI650_03085, partial [Dokdonella sp.]